MFLKIAVFVVPLGFDTFAVAVLLGLRRMRPLRPAATFTFFEAVMPLVGLLIGRLVGARFETPAVIVGGIVLLGVAIYMFKEALEQEEEAERLAFTTLRTAAFAGFGISMDELAIGFPMGTSGLPVPETIGATTAGRTAGTGGIAGVQGPPPRIMLKRGASISDQPRCSPIG